MQFFSIDWRTDATPYIVGFVVLLAAAVLVLERLAGPGGRRHGRDRPDHDRDIID